MIFLDRLKAIKNCMQPLIRALPGCILHFLYYMRVIINLKKLHFIMIHHRKISHFYVARVVLTYVCKIVISNVFNLNKHFVIFFFLSWTSEGTLYSMSHA